MPLFCLKFSESEIKHWADRFDDDDLLALQHVAAVRQRGYFLKAEFLDVCRWKTRRSQSRCQKNSEDFIREITSIAFSTQSEQLRIQILTLLQGVQWPTASVLLHLFHTDPYPLLDFRALWSLNCEVPTQYDFPFWQEYTKFTRQLAAEACVPMRTLDRALWQYSKENGP